MKPIDGGMIGPMIEAEASRPPARAGSWPDFSIIGKSRAPSAAASATAEPERLESMQAAKIATNPRPPLIWPTMAMARLTMRRERPPVFITSPASRKKGTAISGKLSAPFSTFCATICASNMPRYIISATPVMMRAKAIGTPRAIGPRRAPRKMVTVMTAASVLWLQNGEGGLRGIFECGLFLAVTYECGGRHIDAIGRDRIGVPEQDEKGRHAEGEPRAVEDAHRNAGRRRRDVKIDQRLGPAAADHQPSGDQHHAVTQEHRELGDRFRQAGDEGVDPEMGVLTHRHDGAEESQPDEEDARQLLGRGDALIEGVTKHDIAENEHDHPRQQQSDRHLQRVEIKIDDTGHSLLPSVAFAAQAIDRHRTSSCMSDQDIAPRSTPLPLPIKNVLTSSYVKRHLLKPAANVNKTGEQ
ncbi:hypothetical protein RHECNPAF_13600122 [Rhizobium etli CNPAF512]|nr:hypothetical protein RHECNPAF_13600122 [Rhizobium etli CNPAF512]